MEKLAINQAKKLFNMVINIVNKKDSNPNMMVGNLINNIDKMNKSKGRKKTTETTDSTDTASEIDINEFKSYNQILSVLHAGLGTGFSLYFNNLNKKFKDAPINGIDTLYRYHQGSYSIQNDELVQKWESLPIENSPSIKSVQQLILLFFYITSGFHAYYAGTANGQYGQNIANANNWVRWIEYSITSTLMLYIIAILSGVKDENVYGSIFSINIAMIYTGQLVEEYANDNVVFLGRTVGKWTVPMVLGFVLLFTEFSVIIRDFNKRIGTLQDFISANKDDPFFKDFQFPNWIKYTIYALFTFFSSFGVISLYGVTTNDPKSSYPNTERLYLIFSLLSKATLGAFVAYGLGQRQSVESNEPGELFQPKQPTKSVQPSQSTNTTLPTNTNQHTKPTNLTASQMFKVLQKRK